MGDLQVGEAYKDKVMIIQTATGSPWLVQTPTCTYIDESGNRSVGVVTEESNGWYTCTFTPDAAGTWSTEWALAGATIYTAYKTFKVGGGEVGDLWTRLGHNLTRQVFFSASQISATADTTTTDAALPSVVLPNITGTIVSAYAGLVFRALENTNVAANKLSGAQEIQVKESVGGAWTDCIELVDDQFGVAASTREGGTCITGKLDVVAQVAAFNKTYNFQWDEPLTDQDSLILYDVQTFLIISYY